MAVSRPRATTVSGPRSCPEPSGGMRGPCVCSRGRTQTGDWPRACVGARHDCSRAKCYGAPVREQQVLFRSLLLGGSIVRLAFQLFTHALCGCGQNSAYRGPGVQLFDDARHQECRPQHTTRRWRACKRLSLGVASDLATPSFILERSSPQATAADAAAARPACVGGFINSWGVAGNRRAPPPTLEARHCCCDVLNAALSL